MTFQKNYASPKTCRYLRIVDNGIDCVKFPQLHNELPIH